MQYNASVHHGISVAATAYASTGALNGVTAAVNLHLRPFNWHAVASHCHGAPRRSLVVGAYHTRSWHIVGCVSTAGRKAQSGNAGSPPSAILRSLMGAAMLPPNGRRSGVQGRTAVTIAPLLGRRLYGVASPQSLWVLVMARSCGVTDPWDVNPVRHVRTVPRVP